MQSNRVKSIIEPLGAKSGWSSIMKLDVIGVDCSR
jgi:hypothetical protein